MKVNVIWIFFIVASSVKMALKFNMAARRSANSCERMRGNIVESVQRNQ